ncbi:hypothetical protein ES703_116808 [subsurface metagenome]
MDYSGFFCGSFGCIGFGKSFSERIGGVMIEFDVQGVRVAMVAAVELAVAGKKMVSKGTPCYDKLCELERRFRDSAWELQRVEKLMRDG